jgi:hypothetical protein
MFRIWYIIVSNMCLSTTLLKEQQNSENRLWEGNQPLSFLFSLHRTCNCVTSPNLTEIMAANLQALRAALTRIGFDAPVSNNITDVENIDSLEELKLLRSEDVETLCQTIHSPGGLVNNPNAGIAGQPPQIRNPGRHVSARAKKNLKLATFYLRH